MGKSRAEILKERHFLAIRFPDLGDFGRLFSFGAMYVDIHYSFHFA
jgi:hypothetical protein